MNPLQKLAIKRLKEIGQLILTTHEDLERWKKDPLSDMDRTKLSIKLTQAVQDQNEWIRAIEDSGEDESD
jgi:hypothetical protein